METIGKIFDRAEKAEARVKELEMFLTHVMKGGWKGRFNDWVERKSFHGEQR
jgi:hypothetical protein